MNKFIETDTQKVYRSDDYNYIFSKRSGDTIIWGRTLDDNPDVAPFNLLLDMEITQQCTGIGNYGPCKMCYKKYPAQGHIMSLETAKAIIDKLPRECTQIAFGTDAKLISNPVWYDIFKYARESGFIPNVTVADIDDATADKLASVCGAVAVSRYHDKDICYNSIKSLTDKGMKYVNMHIILSQETMDIVYETIDDIMKDDRLKGLNAIVFLSLKQKGRGESYHCITQEQFSEIAMKCIDLKIKFGFDSCSANKFLTTINNTEHAYMSTFVEKCESTCASFYINAKGEGFPCSFTEGTYGWETGIDILSCNDFINDVWQNPRIIAFRNKLLTNNRNCPIFHI